MAADLPKGEAPGGPKIEAMRTTALTLILVATMAACGWARLGDSQPNPYQTITTNAQIHEILAEVLANLRNHFGIVLQDPVDIHLVNPQTMDKLFANSPYTGAEEGLYTGIKDGYHQVYIMKGWNRDKTEAITAHELTHAWQQENGLMAYQTRPVIEGLAMWVQYKYYQLIGAYQKANDMRNDTADPVYGVGLHALLDLEQRVGPDHVLQAIVKCHTIKDIEGSRHHDF